MAVYKDTIRLSTRGHADIIDITAQLARRGGERGAPRHREGGGRGIDARHHHAQYEPGCVADLRRALELVAPANDNYAHNARWGDQNGFAHPRSAPLGTAKSFPVRDGRLGLGTWQQVVLCDFDDCARQREVVVTVVRE